MHFDGFTIPTASCAALFISGLLLQFFRVRDRSAGWLAWWASGFVVLGAGNVLVMDRPALPLVVSAAAESSAAA